MTIGWKVAIILSSYRVCVYFWLRRCFVGLSQTCMWLGYDAICLFAASSLAGSFMYDMNHCIQSFHNVSFKVMCFSLFYYIFSLLYAFQPLNSRWECFWRYFFNFPSITSNLKSLSMHCQKIQEINGDYKFRRQFFIYFIARVFGEALLYLFGYWGAGYDCSAYTYFMFSHYIVNVYILITVIFHTQKNM